MRHLVPALALLFAASATATPVQLTHTGRLLDTSGSPINGLQTITVALYASSDPNVDALWDESYDLTLNNGYFAVVLGADGVGKILDDSVFDGTPRYVGLQVTGSDELQRQALATSPSAIHATNVGGGEVRLSDTSEACSDSNRGALKYDGAVWVCTDTDWTTIRGGLAGETPLATGGTTSTYVVGDVTYQVHAFTAVGSQILTVSQPGIADILVVAGGGSGGGDLGGGGGAGGVRYIEGFTLDAQVYDVTVGAGGAQTGTARQSNTRGNNGQNSSFGPLVALGGGGGGAWWAGASQQNGLAGGSAGGGAGGQTAASGAGGQPSGGGDQGSAGGGSFGGNPHIGGGGGGAMSAGTSGTATVPGSGGAGRTLSITGSPVTYGGGGGGSHYGTSGNGTYGGPGGAGGGGLGGFGASSTANGTGKPGLANTGGGGGGGSYVAQPGAGGAGGSGVVIVRYPL